MTENIACEETYASFPLVPLGDHFSGEKTRPDVDHYAGKIRQAWQKTTDGIFETADLIAEAVETLHDGELKRLHERLPFTGSTFSKLYKIACDERLRAKSLHGQLPPNYTTLYEISGLTDVQLEEALERGLIHPDMKRSVIEQLRGRKPKEAPQSTLFASIFQMEQPAPGRTSTLTSGLTQLLSKFPEFELRDQDGNFKYRKRDVPDFVSGTMAAPISPSEGSSISPHFNKNLPAS